MALWAYAFLTVAELKRGLGLNAFDVSQDAYLEELINASCQLVEEHIKRFILQRAAVVEQYDGEGLPHLQLNHAPAVVASVYDDSERAFTAATLLVAGTDYLVNSAEGLIEALDHGYFYDGRKNVKVTYAAGWLLADIPHAIKKATELTAQNLRNLDGAGKGLLGVAAVSAAGGGSVSPNSQLGAQDAIPNQAQVLLRPYVHRRELGF